VTQTRGLSSIAKAVTGMSQKRQVPKFAKENFKMWFFKRPVMNHGKPPVILWADTFNNYFHPQVAKAAVEVLEDAGFQVKVPKAHLCCGRPLYDYGMLDKAKAWLQEILDHLRDDIRQGVPVVGLEPSCVAVFRDELMGLFPHDQDAWRLKSQTYILSEFLEQRVHDYKPPKLDRKAVVQGHCHHKAVLQIKDEASILRKLGLDFEILDSGCCGMAGSFGFEPRHYDVSVAVGERKLMPKIRQTPLDNLVITNGFSCREQILQLGRRESMHLAEVIKMSLDLQKAQSLTTAAEPLSVQHSSGVRAFNIEPPPVDAGRLSP
jgi:Fe-S oxidoreductase